MTSRAFAISPLGRCHNQNDRAIPLWKVELHDLARGLCGGLIVALPLLYTLEMWERARYIASLDLMLILIAAYFINVAASFFCGFKARQKRVSPWFDALTAMGIGAFASVATLYLIGRFGFDTPPKVLISMVTLELIPVSLGVSLAKNQLGASRSCDEEDERTWAGVDSRKLLATLIGAILFAFNVAPTVEPKVILTTITPWHIIAIALFSLFISWLMVENARFQNPDNQGKGKFLALPWVETVVSYLVSLLVSASFLWTFGYIDLGTDMITVLSWVIVLGYATTLGGSAGRLIL